MQNEGHRQKPAASMKLLTQTLLDDLASKAATATRGRAHHNIHADAVDPVQRFFVAADRRTYIRPHRHLQRGELGVALRGSFDLLTFTDEGTLVARQPFGARLPAFAYEAELLTWHTLVAREDGSIFLEVKQGPYDPATAAEFAAWAPPEGDAAVPAIVRWLVEARVGERFK
jgi:cupin fold WbuC family metalloprotein